MRHHIPIALLVFVFISFILFLTPKSSFAPGFVGFIERIFASPRAWFYSTTLDKNPESELQKQNIKLTEKMVDYEKLKQDNVALRSQFQESHVTPEKLLPVHIIGFLGQPGYPTAFIIDQGKTSGIKKGMIVILGKNFIGKVQSVNAEISEVLLPQSTNFSMLAVTSKNNASGIVTGAGDVVLLNNVTITDTLARGDIVITKGEVDPSGDGAPPGFIFGTIVKVDKNDARPFQNGVIKPSVNYAKLSLVFIVLE